MGIDKLPREISEVFIQRDVRRTPASTATATSGTNSITDSSYVVLNLDGDLENERVLTAGEGIDLVDGGPNGNITIVGEFATDSGNKGIATYNPSDFDVAVGVVSIDDSGVDHDAIGNTHNMTTDIDARMTAGEGINYVEGTISAETASETNRGIATFDGDDFTVNTGDVTLKATVAKTFDGDTGTATAAVHNIDILGGDGISTVGASNDITITNDDHGAVVTNSAHVAGDGSDHADVAANTALLANKTSYLSIPGISFVSSNPDTDQTRNSTPFGFKTPDADGISFAAPINLPHGVVVTEVIVWGNAGATAETWSLIRMENDTLTTGDTMATAVIGTADATIMSATIDNSTHRYMINAESIDTNDIIFGARITYTTDYD